jgi:glutaredoxin
VIKIYTQPGCAPCHQAVAYLTRKGWPFEEVDVRRTRGAVDHLRRLGVLATPALVVGDQVLVGFDPGAIDRAVAAQATGSPAR